MVDGKIYTKQEVYSYLASQGLVYSGLDEHFDEWFDNYSEEFEYIGEDKYIYHEDGF